MQKVEGSSPFSRSSESPALAGLSRSCGLTVRRSREELEPAKGVREGAYGRPFLGKGPTLG